MKLSVMQDFLEENLLLEAQQTALQLLRHNGNMFTTNAHWNADIVKDSFPVFVHNILQDSVLYESLTKTIEEKTKLFVAGHSIMIYYWTRFSYIPWHDDRNYGGGLTIYLNDQWHEDFGGYFLYEDKNEIKAILPKRNLAVLQQGGIRHSTTPVHFDGGMRMTLQVFLEKNK